MEPSRPNRLPRTSIFVDVKLAVLPQVKSDLRKLALEADVSEDTKDLLFKLFCKLDRED